MSKAIKEILQAGSENEELLVKGWVRTKRGSKNVSFIALNDGSCLGNLQVVAEAENFSEEDLKDISTGAALAVKGILAPSKGSGQAWELIAKEIEVMGKADPDTFPMQPKKHSMEFLRDNAHLRFRTNTMAAVMRIRHKLSFAIHNFFNEGGFYHLHTPIITGSDAEGAGEMFRVTTLPANEAPTNEEGGVDYSEDFFGKETNLTVSGQLEAELGALALGKVYTFGPTFRAENSNTTRHLAEFWMVEPEVAFADLKDNMDLAEAFLKYCVQYVLDNCAEDVAFLDQRFNELESKKPTIERATQGLLERLEAITKEAFQRITYTEAIDILHQSKPYKKKKFKYPVEWGTDLQSEHERYLVEKHFGKPVIITDYPASFKAFYMRLNEDGKTVAAMDILFEGIGEIIGGSQREERLDVLEQKMADFNIDPKELWWYLDTRKFGTCPHAGFGLGFERLVQFVTGMGNIRDVIPFPRTPKSADF